MDTPTLLSADALTIYLNDHLAGATFGCEVVRRAAASNAGDPEFGPALSRLARDIDADRTSLLAMIASLRVPRDRVKIAVAWVFEKLARAKPNGRLFRYAPLSRLLELEMLASGIEGKAALWSALRAIAPQRAELDVERLNRLLERARSQQAEVQRLQLRAGQLALAPSS